MIIIFEGLDNCGKTTLVKMISKYYESRGKYISISKEFETNIGHELKNMANKKLLDPILKTYLFATDRYIRVKEFSKYDLSNNIILFDRYVPSAIAYRMSEGINKEWVISVNSIFPKPDLGFYIDITPEESIKRNDSTKFNIKASAEHLAKVRKAYLSILEENNLILIDGMRSLEEILKEILQIIDKSIK